MKLAILFKNIFRIIIHVEKFEHFSLDQRSIPDITRSQGHAMLQVIREIYRVAILSGKPVTRIPERYTHCAHCVAMSEWCTSSRACIPSKVNKVQRLGANNTRIDTPAILLAIFGFVTKRNRQSILMPSGHKSTTHF